MAKEGGSRRSRVACIRDWRSRCIGGERRATGRQSGLHFSCRGWGVQLLKIFTCYLWATHAPGSERANSNSVSRRGYFSLPFKNLVHAVLSGFPSRRRRRRRMENLEARIHSG